MHIVFKYLYGFFFQSLSFIKNKKTDLKNTHLIFFDIIFAEYLEIFSKLCHNIFEKITKKCEINVIKTHKGSNKKALLLEKCHS